MLVAAALLPVATPFAPASSRRAATVARRASPDDEHRAAPAAAPGAIALLASAVPPPPDLAAPVAVAAAPPARALLSWANAPYLGAAAFVGYRGYKYYGHVREEQTKAIAAYGKDLKLGKKQSRAQFLAVTQNYKKKFFYTMSRRGPALFASGLGVVANKPASLASLKAFKDLAAVHGAASAAAIVDGVEAGVPTVSSRGKILFYATRCGLESPKLAALAAEGLDGSAEFLAATQRNLAEQIYVQTLGEAPYAVDAAAAAELGLSAADAAQIVDDLNNPEEEDDREDWRKELEAKVEAESGALPTAADVDTTDKFADEGDPATDEMMLTCECDECGYTLFIAAGREGKFFGDSYKCPECGAPKSKFTVDMAGEDVKV